MKHAQALRFGGELTDLFHERAPDQMRVVGERLVSYRNRLEQCPSC
jgi:hypothetical protein